MAATLAAGKGAVLSHGSAALLWKIWRGAERSTQVVVPRQSHRDICGVELHFTRRLEPRDVRRRNLIPVTSVDRTLVDLADMLSPQQLANVMHEAAFRKLFDPGQVQAQLGRLCGRTNLTVIQEALDACVSGSAGTRSQLEDRFLSLIRAGRLGEPEVNVKVHAGRRRIEVPFLWRERKVCVEIDGAGHRRPWNRRQDADRDRVFTAHGYRVLRIDGWKLESDPDGVTAAVRECLSQPPEVIVAGEVDRYEDRPPAAPVAGPLPAAGLPPVA